MASNPQVASGSSPHSPLSNNLYTYLKHRVVCMCVCVPCLLTVTSEKKKFPLKLIKCVFFLERCIIHPYIQRYLLFSPSCSKIQTWLTPPLILLILSFIFRKKVHVVVNAMYAETKLESYWQVIDPSPPADLHLFPVTHCYSLCEHHVYACVTYGRSSQMCPVALHLINKSAAWKHHLFQHHTSWVAPHTCYSC